MTGMQWYAVRLPETGGVSVVPASALDHYRGRGWLRVSDALDDDAKEQFVAEDYADAPALDAEDVQPEPEPEQQPADTEKE